MPVITLPDGSQRSFDNPISVHDVAADIGPGLAKAALAGVVDGREVDTSHLIENDASLAIITERDDAGLEVIRHSTAHLLAMATQELFPGVQVTIGLHGDQSIACRTMVRPPTAHQELKRPMHADLSPIEPAPASFGSGFLHHVEELVRFIRAEHLVSQRRAAS